MNQSISHTLHISLTNNKWDSLTDTNPSLYTLNQGHNNSDAYFVDISKFTDYWTAYLHTHLAETITEIQLKRSKLGLPELSFDEISLEMLTLGVNILEHGDQAESTPGWYLKLMEKLINVEESNPRMERPVKILLGWLVGLCFSIYPSQVNFIKQMDSLSKFILWMKVFGLEAQADRLSSWMPFFSSTGIFDLKYFLDTCRNLAFTF